MYITAITYFFFFPYPLDTEGEKDENTMEVDDVQPSTTMSKKSGQNKAKIHLDEFRCGREYWCCV